MRRRLERWMPGLVLFAALTVTPERSIGSELLVAGTDYDPAVPTVEAVLGQPIGRWHLRHDQLLRYMEALAVASPRAELVEQGRTHEGRRQVLLVVSSPDNLERMEEILEARRALTDPGLPEPGADALAAMPSVVFLGFSIHGNEASGSNASPLTAYHLAAARSDEVEGWLEKTVVLIDPSLNPDGMGRFATWVNMHRGEQAVAARRHREHMEGWPNGRTNHYWFDLNRDWLLLQHPESRNRVRSFHYWQPNLLGDFHEMGSDSTYFFQPGVAERENPLKPEGNRELTQALAEIHARNLGVDGELFYSGETFDDFYPGKGSTYPDLLGSVGVLFEQASARGHVQETDNRELTFERAIRNHFLTSLSMVEGAATLREELLRYQSDAFRGAMSLAARDPVGGYLFGCPRDAARCSRLVEILRGHRIEVHALARGVEIEGQVHDPEWSWVVPLAQPRYRLIKALFEPQTEFADSTFYDISTWTLPLAFAARSSKLERGSATRDLLGPRVDRPAGPEGSFRADREAYAYLFEWSSYFAPRALHRLLEAGVRPRVATEPLQVSTTEGARDFPRGTVIVPVGGGERRPEIEALLETASRRDGVDVFATRAGLTPVGVDLGSPSVPPLEPVKPLLVVGPGVSTYEAGEVWYLLDHRFGLTLALVERRHLREALEEDFTHLLMVDGSWSDDLDEEMVEEIDDWIRSGGVLVATQRAALWAEEALLAETEDDREPSGEEPPESGAVPDEARRAYADYERDRAAQLISGAIFEVVLDLTHPMTYGYQAERLPVFRNSTLRLGDTDDPYERVALYAAEPLLSGYVSDRKLAEIGSRPALLVSRHGRGTVVRMVDNPNFRAFWYGTSKLYLNAILFAQIVERTSPPSEW